MIISKEMEMKKYMTPEMDVVEIEVRKMLCASDGGGSTSNPDDPEPAPGGDY